MTQGEEEHRRLDVNKVKCTLRGKAYMKRATCIVDVKRAKESDPMRTRDGSSQPTCWLKVLQAEFSGC